MNAYGIFARVYDELTADVDYAARGEYLLKLFARHGKNGKQPETLLDCGCGTGSLLEYFAKQNIDLTGCDGSEEMLSIAAGKLEEYKNVLLLCQPMTELDLYGTVEGAVSTLDSLNHLDSLEDIGKFFGRLKFFIEPGGLFIFDMNTPYKHENILADNAFVYETENVYCVWQNFYSDEDNRVDMSLDLFLPDENDRYSRITEEFSEIAFDSGKIIALAEQNGFEFIAEYDDMTLEPPAADSQRTVFVIKRKGM